MGNEIEILPGVGPAPDSARARKLQHILACPRCKSPGLRVQAQRIDCPTCGCAFGIAAGTPLLVVEDSPVRRWFHPASPAVLAPTRPPGPLTRTMRQVRRFCNRMKPHDRVWSRRSQEVLRRMLEEKNPDAPDHVAVLVGAGLEPVYQRSLSGYRDLIRMGLAQSGRVDVFCDVCGLPVQDQRLDLIFSSSVLEHVYNPEQAIAEMHRVLKPGGCVYAEIPFLRAFHLAPIDYQRYTISGIEELFARHGFALVAKGVCSGPFNAWVLLSTDFARSALSSRRWLSDVLTFMLGAVLHPLKYLDRLVEDRPWAEVCASNFYYLGRKA